MNGCMWITKMYVITVFGRQLVVGRSVGWLAGRLKKAVRNEATNNVKDDP